MEKLRLTLLFHLHFKHSIRFYELSGFKKSESLVIDIGNGYIMDDFKMVRCLLN